MVIRQGVTVNIVEDDIIFLKVDAIVNAANNALLGGGGVDSAIHKGAGPSLLEECRHLGGCPTGEARITGAYGLPCRYVIHTVGPVWHGGHAKEATYLANCYANCFRVASENNLTSLAFPAISTGIYGFPKRKAAKIAFVETERALELYNSITTVIFSCFNQENLKLYREIFSQYLS